MVIPCFFGHVPHNTKIFFILEYCVNSIVLYVNMVIIRYHGIYQSSMRFIFSFPVRIGKPAHGPVFRSRMDFGFVNVYVFVQTQVCLFLNAFFGVDLHLSEF